jgi:hypothetical protein
MTLPPLRSGRTARRIASISTLVERLGQVLHGAAPSRARPREAIVMGGHADDGSATLI